MKFYHCFLNSQATVPDDSPEYSHIALDFVFEYCSGGSLNDFMKASPEDFFQQDANLVKFAYTMLSPLVFLHGFNIVHR